MDIRYVRVFARNTRKMPESVADYDELQGVVDTVYGNRGVIESYTDEMHVHVTRKDGKRRDWVASYQAG